MSQQMTGDTPQPTQAQRRSPHNGLVIGIIAAAVIIIVASAAAIFWMLRSQPDTALSDDMNQALAGLEASISSAESSVTRAQDAISALSEEATAAGDLEALSLAEEAGTAASEVEVALENSREVMTAAGALPSPSPEDVQEVTEATTSLGGLADELDEITDSVEGTTEEIKSRPPKMDLTQIAQGNYSSIEGTWEDAAGNRAEVHASSIDWYQQGELYARLDGLTYIAAKTTEEVPAGQAFDGGSKNWANGGIAWLFEYAPPGVPGRYAAAGVVGFFPAGSPIDLGDLAERGASDESLPRIVWWSNHRSGRNEMGIAEEINNQVMYRVGDAPTEPSDDAATTTGCVAPVAGAYPCAGGPIPDGANPLPGFVPVHTGTYDEVAALTTPSGNIQCSVQTSETVCLVGSWEARDLPGFIEEQGGAGGMTLTGSGPATYSIHSGAPIAWERPSGVSPQTVPYGTVWYFQDYVFASEENGLTVWNTKTGYGALVNRSGLTPFGQ